MNSFQVAFEEKTDFLVPWDENFILNDLTGKLGRWIEDIIEKTNNFQVAFEEKTDFLVPWDENFFLNGLTEDLRGWFSGVREDMGIWGMDIAGFIGETTNVSEEILSYLKPENDNFFLKLAFYPGENVIAKKNNELAIIIKEKFSVIDDVESKLKSDLQNIEDRNEWEGIEANFSHYGIGDQTIVDGEYMNQASEKVRAWIGGLIVFMTMFTWVKVGSTMINS